MGPLQPDWTLAVQIVSFLLFWQVMKWILFVPVERALASRSARTTGDKVRAEELRAEARRIEADVQVSLTEARLQGTREGGEIRRRAEIEEQQIRGRYRDDAAALLERERAATRAQVEAARAPLRTEAERLAASVVAKVLGRAA